MNLNKLLLPLMVILLSSCAGLGIGPTQPIKFKASEVINEASYSQIKSNDGVVLLDVNWGRQWNCGGFENAQLLTLAFDKLPLANASNEAVPNLVLQTPSRINVDPKFINYAYSIPAGEYALSAVSIKAAKSVGKVGFFTAQRDKLFNAGKPTGGTFTVKAGEIVFLGNFYLDCAYGPTLWRYYPDGRKAFEAQVKAYEKSYPFLDLNDVKFRLFKTKNFGRKYELK